MLYCICICLHLYMFCKHTFIMHIRCCKHSESTILDVCSVKYFQDWQWLEALIQGIDSGASGALVCRRRGTTALWGESRLSTNINVLTFKESLVHPWQNISSLCNSLASSTYVLASSWGLGASAAGSLETKVHPRLLAESLWAWKSWDALMHTSLKSEICHQGFLKKWCRGTRWLP